MDHKGLNSQEVLESREKWGSNDLTPPKKVSLFKLFIEKFNDPIIRILIIAAVLSFAISFTHNDFTETLGILIAIFLATGVGFWFEVDASRKFDMLNTIGDQTLVRVMRDGKVVEVGKSDIVKGDIVLLETGEEIPADGKLLESTVLIVNESTLTGESSISKTTDPAQFKKDVTYPSNMVLRGTTVLEGSGVMEVVTIGDQTEIGKVATASTEESGEKTPLTKQLDRLAKIIGVVGFALASLTFFALLFGNLLSQDSAYSFAQLWLLLSTLVAFLIIIARFWLPIISDAKDLLYPDKERSKERPVMFWALIGVVFFAVALSVGYLAFGIDPLNRIAWPSVESLGHILNYFMIAVTMIVVAVPEGLPMSVTLSLALNMRRMLKSNNLVRKMHACETMGAINVICTDKTGTLTKNQMSVQEQFFDNFDRDKNIIFEGIAVNSTAHIDFSTPSALKSIGNPTESSLILWMHGEGVNYAELRDMAKERVRVPFSTLRKYMATSVVSSAIEGKDVIYVKGAPEIIAAMCDNVPANLTEQLTACQNRAMRTLAFAYKIDSTDLVEDEISKGGFTFLGFVAIADPVREDVPAAVLRCIEAGIAIKIVTGDTPATAKEIARQIGLWGVADGDLNHISGVDFEALSDEELMDRVNEIKIMSRARPSDKQRFVRLLQKKGGVVAVTGDGTNDAPALNFAHVGLSMGSGTSVAKQASDITLIDDSFASIGSAVMWGRSLYKNIQRFILFQLTINVVAILTLFVGSFTGMETPLTITQMLWINIIMDTFAAAALASLPPSLDVMKDKPRKESDFIITRDMGVNILGVGAIMVVAFMFLLYYLSHNIADSAYGLSLFFTTFVMVQFWNMFNAKAYASGNSSAFKNIGNSIGFVLVALLIIVGQILIVTYGGKMFRTVPLSFIDWIIVISSTSIVLWIGEIRRFILSISKK